MENNATYGWEPEETKISPMPPSEHQIESLDNPPEEEFLPENEVEEIKETPDEDEIEDDDEVRTDEQKGEYGNDNSRQNGF